MRRVCLVDCDYGLKLAPNPWPCINTKGGSHRLRPPCLYVCLLCYHSTVPPLLWFVRPVKWPISKQIHSPIRTHHAHWDLIYRARVIDTSNRSKISHLNNHIIRPLLSMVVADRATERCDGNSSNSYSRSQSTSSIMQRRGNVCRDRN